MVLLCTVCNLRADHFLNIEFRAATNGIETVLCWKIDDLKLTRPISSHVAAKVNTEIPTITTPPKKHKKNHEIIMTSFIDRFFPKEKILAWQRQSYFKTKVRFAPQNTIYI